MSHKIIFRIFFVLVLLTLLAPLWVFKDLLFPFVTSKAFYLRILVEVTLPFYVFLLLRNPSFRPSFKNPLTASVAACWVFNFLAALVGQNMLRSLWGNFERMGGAFYLGHLVLLYFYVVMIAQASQKYMRAFLIAVIALGGAMSLDGMLVRITGNHFLLNDSSYPRVSSTFGNPIFFASFLIIPVFLTLFFIFLEQGKIRRIVCSLVIALELWCIFLSQTRGAVVGLAIGIFVAAVLYVILTPSRKIKLWGGGGVGAFVLLIALLFTLHNKLPQGGLLHRIFNLRDSNTEARLIQWKTALRGYRDYPLLGVGPENYYVISNKYYDPAIYQYDPSWFDKPHNYLLEILVTSGTLGFLAYASMLVAAVYILWQAYRAKFLGVAEFCLLVCGLIVYEIQNLFVFDTVAASMTFFLFLGFFSYLWHEVYSLQTIQQKNKSRGLALPFAGVVSGITIVIAAYALYAANVAGMRVAKNVNYGFAYSSAGGQTAEEQIANIKTAENYFEQASRLPFDFDPVQFASKYGAFAAQQAASNKDPALTQEIVKNALAVEENAVSRVPNDPTIWQQLSTLYASSALLNKTPVDPRALQAAHKATELAPKRPEPVTTLAQIQLYAGDQAGAESTLKAEIANVPGNIAIQMQLALMYWYTGKVDEALALGEAILAKGYRSVQANQIDWMATAYEKQNKFADAVRIYKLAISGQPNAYNDYWQLAQDDLKLGNKAEAISIAQQLMKAFPDQTQQLQKFIDSVK